MSLFLPARSPKPEKMDIEVLEPESASQILKNLETVNTWLGGARATLWHLKRFSRHWTPGQRIRILDWGTGGADLPRAIVRWARENQFSVEIVGVDTNAVILDYAKEACAAYPEIRLFQGDITRAEYLQEPFDYAISSLCLHHLTDEQVVTILEKSDRFSVRGIIMNDLLRSTRAWAWIWMLSRLTRLHPIVRHDGPLSVRRAFTSRELKNFARKAGLTYAKVYTHFGYRLVLAGEKI